jgi:hypothetical protein
MSLQAGDSFWFKTRFEPLAHLRILCTAPHPLYNTALWINMTTLRTGQDITTVLQPSDHPAIRHASIVLYSDAELVDLAKLSNWLQVGLATRGDRFSPSVLKRIQSGILASKFTPRKFKQYFRAEQAAARV